MLRYNRWTIPTDAWIPSVPCIDITGEPGPLRQSPVSASRY